MKSYYLFLLICSILLFNQFLSTKLNNKIQSASINEDIIEVDDNIASLMFIEKKSGNLKAENASKSKTGLKEKKFPGLSETVNVSEDIGDYTQGEKQEKLVTKRKLNNNNSKKVNYLQKQDIVKNLRKDNPVIPANIPESFQKVAHMVKHLSPAGEVDLITRDLYNEYI